MKKRKRIYIEKFKANSFLDEPGRDYLMKCLKQKGTDVHLLERGHMSDDTGFVTIRLEGFK